MLCKAGVLSGDLEYGITVQDKFSKHLQSCHQDKLVEPFKDCDRIVVKG